jgi:hydrogenase expression/formation protein HypC
MCLAVPGKVIEVRGQEAVVDMQGNRPRVSIALTPTVQPGGWVLVHAGFAIAEVDEQSARETWDYLAEVADAFAEDLPGGPEVRT